MTSFLLGVAVGAFLAYAIQNPDVVKGWLDAIRARIGK